MSTPFLKKLQIFSENLILAKKYLPSTFLLWYCLSKDFIRSLYTNSISFWEAFTMIDLTEFESRAVPLRALGVVVSQNGTQLALQLWDDTSCHNVYSASKALLWQSALRKRGACSPSTKSSRTHSRMTCPKSFPTT